MVKAETTGSPGSEEVAKAVEAGWLRVEKVKDRKMVALLQAGLRGRGECECIVLAREIGAKAVLTDDKKERGYAVEKAGTGRGALAKAVSRVYAAVVMNLRLREMSGLGLLETIRAMPGYQKV